MRDGLDMFRVFIAIGQTPFDPTSGAAQATLHMAEMLAGTGCAVRCLSTSGTEGIFNDPLPTGDFTANGVQHRILLVPQEMKHSWHHLVGDDYNHSFDDTLRDFNPHVLFTFGDEAPDHARRMRSKAAGTKVVFCLHNGRYVPNMPEHVDVFLTPSLYLTRLYRTGWGSVPRIETLPTPIVAERVIAPTHDPIFVTFINPQPAKGLRFMIRFAEQLGIMHPDIPLRIVEARATAADFLQAAKLAGIDLARFPNLYFSPGVSDMREIWSTTRIVLVPSVWNEPAGRVAVEAMLNGAVAIVSDRGGLPEQVGTAGRILPLPEWLTPESGKLPTAAEVAPWLVAVRDLCDDDDLFSRMSQSGRSEAERFLSHCCGPRYMELIQSITFTG